MNGRHRGTRSEKIALETPVAAIDPSGPRLRIRTGRGDIEARLQLRYESAASSHPLDAAYERRFGEAQRLARAADEAAGVGR